MRINVYAEELTTETVVIEKEVEGRKFYGVRLYLQSPLSLHHTETDDDRSAITFWVPWKDGQNHHATMQDIFQKMLSASWDARKRDGQ